MEHGDPLAKARAEAADGLGRQRDLGHQHAGRTAGHQHALNSGEVDLSFAGAGDAVDQHHVAMSVQTSALNLRERLLLAVGKGRPAPCHLPRTAWSARCSHAKHGAPPPPQHRAFQSALMIDDMLL